MTLYDSSISSIFSIPETTWQLVTYRVGGTLIALEAGIDRRLHDLVPEFPRLTGQCEAWHGYTFNALLRFVPMVERFAAQMAEELTVLQHTVGHLDRSAPLPSAQAQVIRNTMIALERPASQIATQASALAPQLAAFCAANLPVGQAARQLTGQLNAIPDFGIAVPLLLHLDGAMKTGMDIGADAWKGIATGLAQVAAGSSTLDWRRLAGPDIAATIANWKRLQTQASNFSAAIQDCACPEFMSGSWVTNCLPATSVFTAQDTVGLFGQYLMLGAGRTPPYQLQPVQETRGLPLAVTLD